MEAILDLQYRLLESFISHMPYNYREKNCNWVIVQQFLQYDTSKQGRHSSIDKCVALGINPNGYTLERKALNKNDSDYVIGDHIKEFINQTIGKLFYNEGEFQTESVIEAHAHAALDELNLILSKTKDKTYATGREMPERQKSKEQGFVSIYDIIKSELNKVELSRSKLNGIFMFDDAVDVSELKRRIERIILEKTNISFKIDIIDAQPLEVINVSIEVMPWAKNRGQVFQYDASTPYEKKFVSIYNIFSKIFDDDFKNLVNNIPNRMRLGESASRKILDVTGILVKFKLEIEMESDLTSLNLSDILVEPASHRVGGQYE